MTQKQTNTELDFEKIVIYPEDYDSSTRHKLYLALKKLGVHFSYEYYG